MTGYRSDRIEWPQILGTSQNVPPHDRLAFLPGDALAGSCIRRRSCWLGHFRFRGSRNDERYAWSFTCRWCRRTALPLDPRSRQARCPLCRPIPHHRHHPLQLHQLRPAPRLHPHPVQGALAQPPHPRRLGPGRRQRTWRVHRDPPPMQRVSKNWYMGTADAVYQNIYSIGSRSSPSTSSSSPATTSTR